MYKKCFPCTENKLRVGKTTSPFGKKEITFLKSPTQMKTNHFPWKMIFMGNTFSLSRNFSVKQAQPYAIPNHFEDINRNRGAYSFRKRELTKPEQAFLVHQDSTSVTPHPTQHAHSNEKQAHL